MHFFTQVGQISTVDVGQFITAGDIQQHQDKELFFVARFHEKNPKEPLKKLTYPRLEVHPERTRFCVTKCNLKIKINFFKISRELKTVLRKYCRGYICVLFSCLILKSSAIAAFEVACIANLDSNSISIVDIKNGKALAPPVTKGIHGPSALAITPNGKLAYVANAGNNTVSIIDIENDNKVVGSITQDINSPYAIAITPDGKYVYVANLGSNSISIIDIENDNRCLQPITHGIERPYAIAINPNGKYVYIANLGSNSLSVVEVDNNNEIVQSITRNISNPYAIAITPNGKYVYVANGGNDSISVIDVHNNNEVCAVITKTINTPYSVAITPNGKYAYIANYDGGISVIDIENDNAVIHSITDNINKPYAIAISANSKYAYIANLGNNSIAVINTDNYSVSVSGFKDINSPYAIAIIPQHFECPISTNNLTHLEPLQKCPPACHLHDQCSLLDERGAMIPYLLAFPRNNYNLYFSKDTGYFYIDDIDEPIKNTLKEGKIWEAHVHDAVKKYALAGTLVLDIGAHIGTETVLMANCVGKYGQVHAFEPQKKIFRELVANCQINQIEDHVKLYHMAIGSQHCQIVTGRIVVNSEGKTNEGGIGLWGGGDLVEMRTLDSFNFENVSLIKIDVEGGENDVIEGMVETLKRNKPVIIIEICGGWIWDIAPPDIKNRILVTQKKLSDLGYKVLPLKSWDYIAFPTDCTETSTL